MPQQVKIQSPIDGKIIATRPVASKELIDKTIIQASNAQKEWRNISLAKRAEYCLKAIEYFENNSPQIAHEITLQMGRPIRYTAGEIKSMAERARYMIEIAPKHLKNDSIENNGEAKRFIRPTPLGIVLTIAPWNYPYLTAVNSIIPALMAGNSVILKHSQQTLLCSEQFALAFKSAGLPEFVFQYLHLDHPATKFLLQQPLINLISFTGSVNAGKTIEQLVAGQFKHLALELGGKDPAYVRADANLTFAVENLVDGAFFNSGQSCCGIERIYVDESIYHRFVKQFVALVKQYRLGDPLDPQTTLGPVINQAAADFVRSQIDQAIQLGAQAEINSNDFDTAGFNRDARQNNYLAPQVLTQVNHSMDIMKLENFGPVVGIMKVTSDEQAISLMNDSDYGLTASIWTCDEAKMIALSDCLDSGTVFMNRCDYLDPALAWTGVKHSGRGCALSHLGYQQLTRPKSFYIQQASE